MTDRWRLRGDGADALWERDGGKGVMLVGTPRKRGFFTEIDYSLTARAKRLALAGAQWADLDGGGDVLYSIGGALYRLPAKQIADAAERGDVSTARLLADFSDMRFEAIPAPYATQRVSSDPEPYAPPLDRVTKEDRRQRRRAAQPAKPKGRSRVR